MKLDRSGYKKRSEYGVATAEIQRLESSPQNIMVGKKGEAYYAYCMHRAGIPAHGSHRDMLMMTAVCRGWQSALG